MKHRLLAIAIAGLVPAFALAQRAPVTDLSTRAGEASGTATAAAAVVGPDATAVRRAMADLTLEIEQLRAEVREMRGQLEVQAHELESLKNRNREALADTDKRLRELERKAAPVAGAAGGTEAPDTAAAPPSAGEQQEYDAAFGLMKQGQYDKAAKAFRAFLTKYPQSDLSDNAQYWIGFALYSVRNFKQALVEFSKVLSEHGSGNKSADALLMIGYSHHELGALDKAREALQQVISRYPNPTRARAAERRLADIKAAEAKVEGGANSKAKKP